MIGQLRPKRALDQRLLQLFEKTAISGQVFRLLIVSEQLIQQLRCNRRVGRHVSLLDKVNSQKPAYTFLLTPSRDSRTAELLGLLRQGFDRRYGQTSRITSACACEGDARNLAFTRWKS